MAALGMEGDQEIQLKDQDLNLNQAGEMMWERRWLMSPFPKLKVIERLDC